MSFPTTPPVVEGQAVMSMLENYARFTGSAKATHVLHLTLRRGPLCSSTLPCGRHPLADVFDEQYGTGEAMVMAHSTVALDTLGMSSELGNQVVKDLASGCRTRTACPRLNPGLQCGNRTGLQCPECASEATKTYGFRVGFCAHMFDFQTRCPEHRCRLISDNEWSRLEVLLNDMHTAGSRQNSLTLSRCVHDLLYARPHQPLWQAIVHACSAKGFALPCGRFRLGPLDRAFKAFFSAGFEDARLSWLVRNEAVAEMSIRAVARARAIHPVLLILLYVMAMEVEPVSNPKPLRAELEPGPVSDPERLKMQRTLWEAHVTANTGLTRTQLRYGLGATWTWLHRHDRAWLLSHQVPAKRPPGGRAPTELQGPLLDVIRNNTEDFRYSDDGREPLPSAYQMRLGFGMREYAFNRVLQVLNPAGKSAQLPAKKEIFVTRRVARAASDLAYSGSQVLTMFARAAKLRPATVANFYQPI